jgi:5-enolpyruvylshikimate-3-phosphate synthase
MEEKESRLQKDFKSRDVQRMRNLITKNYGDKTITQAGYTKQSVEHKEGDVWEENGKNWTIKNGLKQTTTRLDSIKKSILLPIVCPNCSKAMANSTLNKKMWPLHGKCFDCVINMESELKRTGKFEEYQRNMVHSGIKTHIKEMEDLLLELALGASKESFVTEAGDIEEWRGGNIDTTQMIEDLQEYIQSLKDIVGY